MKAFLFSAALLLVSMTTNAQQFGMKAGMNISSWSGKGIDDLSEWGIETSSKVGVYAGIFMNAPLAENFSIQPELLYNGKGAKIGDGVDEVNTNVDYISLPVMFQYNATPQFYLEAGPEFGFLISAKAKSEGESIDLKDEYSGFDFGVGLGAGYYFTPNIGITARYVAGFSDIVKDNESDNPVKNSAFQFGLAYKF